MVDNPFNIHISDTAIIGDYVQLGSGTNVWDFVVIHRDTKIGSSCNIGTMSFIGHDVNIGNNVRIHTQVFCPEYTIIKDDVFIGPKVCITNCKYPNRKKPVLNACLICKGAVLGANSTILPGVIVGEYSLVAAGAVVVENVPPKTIVAGNPATKVRDIEEDELQELKSYGV